MPTWMTDGREAWLDEVTGWVERAVSALGLGPLAAVTPIREREWGAVLRVNTADRVLFFKAGTASSRHEPVIVADIASTHPQLVPELLAADIERGWLLMADQGTPMWDSVDVRREVEIWAEIFPIYADMQRTSAPRVDRWIGAGSPDRRASVLPQLIEELLADEIPLDAEQRHAIGSSLPLLKLVCAELAATPFAEAVDHSDMHGGNVLVGRGHPRLVDWGDACIAHPFVSPFVTYQHAVAKLPASERDAAALDLRDGYLEAWTQDASRAELRDAFAKATWLGHLIRALNFVHQVGTSGEWGEAVATFLVRWHDQHELLGRGDELILTIASQREYE